MGKLREVANRYLDKALENRNGAGTRYAVIDPQGNRYPVTGTVGDTHLAVDANGETVQAQAVVATCPMKRLPLAPQRGWQAQLPALSGELEKYFIQEVQYDNTIGLYYFVLGRDFSKGAAA